MKPSEVRSGLDERLRAPLGGDEFGSSAVANDRKRAA